MSISTDPKAPKEIDVFNRFSKLNKLKITLIALSIAIVAFVTLYFVAKSMLTYTITFETYGGTVFGEVLEDQKYHFLEKTQEPKNLKKEGYYIAGYYTDSEFKNKFEFGKSIWSSKTIYVEWKEGYAVQLFFVEGEDDDDRTDTDKTGIDEEYLKLYHEQYVAPGSDYNLPLVYNTINGQHKGEQLLWYDNELGEGDPFETEAFVVNNNIPLYGRWFDTSEQKYDIDDSGTLIRYLGACKNLYLPDSVKAIKDVSPEKFVDGYWNSSTVADGGNYSPFDKVIDYLERVYINKECTDIGSCAFRSCDSLEKVVLLGNNVTRLGKYAFAYCEKLTDMNLKNSVTTIDSRAFYYAGIQLLTGLNSVETINSGAFINTKIESLNLNKVSFIGQMAFGACYYLDSLVLMSTDVVETDVTTADNNVLYSSTQAQIYVPESLLVEYKSSYPWSAYASRIKNINEYE